MILIEVRLPLNPQILTDVEQVTVERELGRLAYEAATKLVEGPDPDEARLEDGTRAILRTEVPYA